VTSGANYFLCVGKQVFAAPSLNGFGGEPRLRNALAGFFNANFRPVHAVRPEHVVVTAGATEAIEDVIYAVCDEGDSVLVVGPHWREFETHLPLTTLFFLFFTPLVVRLHVHFLRLSLSQLQARKQDRKGRVVGMVISHFTFIFQIIMYTEILQKNTAGLLPTLSRKQSIHAIIAKPPTYHHWDNYLLPSLQAAYDFSPAKSRIKAVLLCNPNTPLSRCYPRETLLDLMEFCQERNLHLICDEVSALLTVKAKGGVAESRASEFVSALSLTEPLAPEGARKLDPSRVHVVWSGSKLFGVGGLKVVRPNLSPS